MEVRSPNSEPEGSRRVRRGGPARRGAQHATTFPLVFHRFSRPRPEARCIRADWVTGNREARPGLR